VSNQAEWGAHFDRFLVYKQIACRDLLSNQKPFGVILFIPNSEIAEKDQFRAEFSVSSALCAFASPLFLPSLYRLRWLPIERPSTTTCLPTNWSSGVVTP
jgi:hypothetical protein